MRASRRRRTPHSSAVSRRCPVHEAVLTSSTSRRACVENKPALSSARFASRRHPQWQIQAQGSPRLRPSLEPRLVGQRGDVVDVKARRRAEGRVDGPLEADLDRVARVDLVMEARVARRGWCVESGEVRWRCGGEGGGGRGGGGEGACEGGGGEGRWRRRRWRRRRWRRRRCGGGEVSGEWRRRWRR